jgi:hypothetical protein
LVFSLQATHDPRDNKYPELQVKATLFDEHVTAPYGQTMHAALTNEYPELHDVKTV